MSVASYIDHTLLQPLASPAAIRQLCTEAAEHGFPAVCVPPYFVGKARQWAPAAVRVATVVGFPFGYSAIDAKLQEIRQAIEDGADELDMVINLAALKSGDIAHLEQEIQACTGPAHASGKVLKIIIESGMLTDADIIRCCELYAAAGEGFLKTSTGYAEKGASVQAVELLRQHLPATIAIKAAGGIRTLAFAQDLIAAGATRLGCSASLAILAEEKAAAAGPHS